MTLISDDPSWWPLINANRIGSYFVVIASAGVMYDWALTFGREVELVWRQRWSLVTFLYLSVRYLGIIYAIISILVFVPSISVTDAGCRIMFVTLNWLSMVVFVLLGVIMITRLHAMYSQSRKILIFLVAIFLAVNITGGVITAISMSNVSSDELILSGTYQCTAYYEGNDLILNSLTWILPTVWEVLTLCLALWIAVQYFRELRKPTTRWFIKDCSTVLMILMKTHVVYFASFVVVSCFNLVYLSPAISADTYALKTQIYIGFLQISLLAQRFVMGPRLILDVREFHAKLVAGSDAETGMTSVAFQNRVHVSTGSCV